MAELGFGSSVWRCSEHHLSVTLPLSLGEGWGEGIADRRYIRPLRDTVTDGEDGLKAVVLHDAGDVPAAFALNYPDEIDQATTHWCL